MRVYTACLLSVWVLLPVIPSLHVAAAAGQADQAPATRDVAGAGGGLLSIEQCKAMLNSSAPQARMTGAWELGRLGPGAVKSAEVLIKALKDEKSYVRGNAAWALGQIKADSPPTITALAAAFDDESVLVRQCAAEALVRLGPPAVSALEMIWSKALKAPARRGPTTVANDDDYGGGRPVAAARREFQPAMLALAALGKIGQPGMDSLVRAAACGDRDIAIAAAQAMGSVGAAAVGKLQQMLTNADAKIRVLAAGALGDMGEQAAGATQLLVNALGDREPMVRMAAARALGAIGPKAAGAEQKLRGMLADSQPELQAMAVDALVKVLPASPEVAQAIMAKTAEGDRVAEFCLMRLMDMDPNATGKALAGTLATSTGGANMGIVALVGQLPPQATRGLLPQLTAMLARSEPQVAARFAQVLHHVGDPTPECLPSLLAILRAKPQPRSRRDEMFFPDEEFAGGAREYAVWAVGRLGPAAKDAAALLVTTDENGKKKVGPAEAEALGLIGPPAGEYVPVIISSCAKDRVSRGLDEGTAAKALVGIGPACAPQMVALIADKDSDDFGDSISGMAIRVLEQLGPKAAPALAAGLKGASTYKQTVICGLLAKCGPAAEPAVEELKKLLNESDEQLRQAAVAALAAAGAKAAPAVGELIAKLPDYEAQKALIAVGPSAADELLNAYSKQKEKDSSLCHAIMDVLGKIGPGSKQVVPALLELAKNDDLLAIRALVECGPAAEPAVDLLVEKLQVTGSYAQSVACHSLARLGIGVDKVMPVLMKMAESYPPRIYDRPIDLAMVIRTYARLRPGPVLEALSRAQKMPPTSKTRRPMIENLAPAVPAMDPMPDEGIKLLLELMRQGSDEAKKALGQVGPAAIPQVAPLLAKGDPVISERDLREVADEITSPNTMMTVELSLWSEEETDKVSGTIFCRKMMTLKSLLEHGDPAVRKMAADGWRAYEDIRERMLVNLTRAMSSTDPKVRTFAAGEILQLPDMGSLPGDSLYEAMA